MKEFDGVRLVELAEARFDMLEGGDALRGDEDVLAQLRDGVLLLDGAEQRAAALGPARHFQTAQLSRDAG